jgi:dTDP-4-amino-4,6-dideoxygalactose transaminase
MITTNAEDLFKYCWSKKDHGKSYDKVFNTIHPPGFRWLHDSFGSNYRMTEMQAAIGRIQLRNLDQSVKRRNILANSYDRVANKYSCIRRIDIDKEIYTHAKYKHYLMVNPGGLDEGWSRDKIIEELLNIDFPCTTGSCSEIYLEDAFYPYRACISNKRMKVAKELGDNSIMLLVHPTITPVDQVMLSIKLRRILEMASKEKYD